MSALSLQCPLLNTIKTEMSISPYTPEWCLVLHRSFSLKKVLILFCFVFPIRYSPISVHIYILYTYYIYITYSSAYIKTFKHPTCLLSTSEAELDNYARCTVKQVWPPNTTMASLWYMDQMKDVRKIQCSQPLTCFPLFSVPSKDRELSHER